MKYTVILQKSIKTADGLGGFTETWKDVCFIDGIVSKTKRKSLIDHNMEEITITHKFFFYDIYQYCPQEYDRIKYNGEIFEVVSFENLTGKFCVIELKKAVV